MRNLQIACAPKNPYSSWSFANADQVRDLIDFAFGEGQKPGLWGACLESLGTAVGASDETAVAALAKLFEVMQQADVEKLKLILGLPIEKRDEKKASSGQSRGASAPSR